MALAIFDLDATLIGGDCASLWNAWMVRLGLLPLAGRRTVDVARVVVTFVDEVIEPIIYRDASRCVAAHREAGDRVRLISASAHFLASTIASRLQRVDHTMQSQPRPGSAQPCPAGRQAGADAYLRLPDRNWRRRSLRVLSNTSDGGPYSSASP